MPRQGFPIIPGVPPSTMAAPPSVRPTSSASFVVDLPAVSAPCQSELGWVIEMRLEGLQGSWEHVGTAVQASSFAVERLRCPANGCRFKLSPDVQLWEGAGLAFDGASVVVHNLPLPPVASPGLTSRIELQLHETTWNSILRVQLRSELAVLLDIKEPTLVEAHVSASSVFVVMDLVTASEGAAQEAAQRLATLVHAQADLPEADADDQTAPLLQRVDRETGVLMLTADNEWQVVQPAALSEGESSLWGTLSWIALALLTTCAAALAWTQGLCGQLPCFRSRSGHPRVAYDSVPEVSESGQLLHGGISYSNNEKAKFNIQEDEDDFDDIEDEEFGDADDGWRLD